MLSRLNKILFTKFVKRDSKEYVEHFLNLVYFARVDGEISENERNYLATLGISIGFSPKIVSAIIDTGDETEFVVPHSIENKQRLFFDMIRLASLDGSICQKEKVILFMLANRLGYTQKEIESALFNYNNRKDG